MFSSSTYFSLGPNLDQTDDQDPSGLPGPHRSYSGYQCATVAPDKAPVEEFQWDHLEHPPWACLPSSAKISLPCPGWTKPITTGKHAHATDRRPQTSWPNELTLQDGPHPKGGSWAKEWELCSFCRRGHGHVQHPHVHLGFCTQRLPICYPEEVAAVHGHQSTVLKA